MPPLNHVDRHGVADSGSRRPTGRFDQSSPSSFSVPGGGEATAIVAGERRLPAGLRGRGWIRHSRAILPVVAR